MPPEPPDLAHVEQQLAQGAAEVIHDGVDRSLAPFLGGRVVIVYGTVLQTDPDLRTLTFQHESGVVWEHLPWGTPSLGSPSPSMRARLLLDLRSGLTTF